MDIEIRRALRTDLKWIKGQPGNRDFLPPTLGQDDAVIALVDGQPAGLGILKRIDWRNAELGGISVLPEYCSLGIEEKIVTQLISLGKQYQNIFFTTSDHLDTLYSRLGFKIMGTNPECPSIISRRQRLSQTI
jgi:N-acetylglutamate synthase-like GNAT family acetyltransferase